MQNNWYNGILSCKTKGTIAIGNMKGNIVKQIKFRYQVDKSYIALGFFMNCKQEIEDYEICCIID